ncbi:MAG: GIY-YIG nuclease family protein [Gemmatimonadetes bacterium]|nr:GIY-YIG nuclease family protein [Gemmatimonadota bacterium]MYB98189.1 GIY-YIG nuclease family protein [Gemmatimonadota bacterium]MYI44990.1 GIY-YIG nuclease family protein [Gemmatimonadota bacterium]
MGHERSTRRGREGERFASQLEIVEASFRRLMNRPLVRMDEHRSKTRKEAGVYVIVERDRAMYVGRSRDLRRRLNDHLSSSISKAALAVRMARADTRLRANYKGERSARHLFDTNETFRASFNSATERIGAMHVRWVLEEDDVRQALLEIYAAVELETPFNSFRTH